MIEAYKHKFIFSPQYFNISTDVQCYFCVGGIGTTCDDDTFDATNMAVQDCSAAGYEERCEVGVNYLLQASDFAG